MDIKQTIKEVNPIIDSVLEKYPDARDYGYAYYTVLCLLEQGYLPSLLPLDLYELKTGKLNPLTNRYEKPRSPESMTRTFRLRVQEGKEKSLAGTKRGKQLQEASIAHYSKKNASTVNVEPSRPQIKYEYRGNTAIPV